MTTLYGIRTIAEQSVANLFTANAASLPGVEIALGQTDQTRNLPIIIIHAESARAHPDLGGTPLGNFEITLKIYVYSSADDSTLAEHRQRVEVTQGIMENTAAIQAQWTQGALYFSQIVSDDEAVADRRYGNAIQYTLIAVYPPAS